MPSFNFLNNLQKHKYSHLITLDMCCSSWFLSRQSSKRMAILSVRVFLNWNEPPVLLLSLESCGLLLMETVLKQCFQPMDLWLIYFLLREANQYPLKELCKVKSRVQHVFQDIFNAFKSKGNSLNFWTKILMFRIPIQLTTPVPLAEEPTLS